MKIVNFRGMRKAKIITVLEGSGTEDDIFKEVIYVYDEKNELLGVVKETTI